MFQSLLYWIGRGDALASRASERSFAVSILVVLDWAWGHDSRVCVRHVALGFNPCCIGLGVGTAFCAKAQKNQKDQEISPAAFLAFLGYFVLQNGVSGAALHREVPSFTFLISLLRDYGH
ncbi:hypothetical protein [uncultured Lamprocystis sp.]|uniref:hypothetical protein n=1 Tax=uncultured Lamprocystis sp. TaxID=543132 RepID=UPI0025DE2454|nr:hypothetical protein [uncultured Lamprocystis sp.]